MLGLVRRSYTYPCHDPDTGQQFEDFDAYKAVLEGIREHEGTNCFPTIASF